MAVLLGLHGRRGSGKDATFKFIHEWAKERGVLAARRGAADKLKWSFARLFMPSMTIDEAVIWCDRLKYDGKLRITEERTETEGPDIGTHSILAHEIPMRLAFQRYGNKSHRDIFGDDCWIDLLLPLDADWTPNFQPGSGIIPVEELQLAVVTDVRFPNEAERITRLGGSIWEIDRPGLPGDADISEKPLPDNMVDAVIANDTTLDDLRDEVYRMMTKVYGGLFP